MNSFFKSPVREIELSLKVFVTSSPIPRSLSQRLFYTLLFPHVPNSQQTYDGAAESDCAATVFAIEVTAAQRVSVPFIWGAELRCRSSPSGGGRLSPAQ